jgi:hypothetical protein
VALWLWAIPAAAPKTGARSQTLNARLYTLTGLPEIAVSQSAGPVFGNDA